MATMRQILANRRNSLLSTGARTPEGAVASAANGRTHGLCASKMLRDDERKLIEEREAELAAEMQPEGALQKAQVAEIAAASVRIEMCRLEEENWRFERAERAEFYWDEDRRAEAQELAERLARKPALVVRKLRQTLQGAQWLRQEWAVLRALVNGGPGGSPRPLDEAGRQRAFDLAGLSAEARLVSTRLDLPEGKPVEGDRDAALAAHQAAVIAIVIAELDQLTDQSRVELDQSNRFEIQLGNFPGVDRMTRLARRYEKEAVQRRDKAIEEFRRLQAAAAQAKKEAREREIAAMPLRQRIATQMGFPEFGRALAAEEEQARARWRAQQTPAPQPDGAPAQPANEAAAAARPATTASAASPLETGTSPAPPTPTAAETRRLDPNEGEAGQKAAHRQAS
jgi:hypothetical protein